DCERLLSALRQEMALDVLHFDFHLLSGLQAVLRKGKWAVTAAVHMRTEPTVIALWPGFHEGGIHGLAVDLGSTTIAGHLVNLVTGDVIASSGLMNPQIRFGEDLMSRVSYGMMNPGGAAEMTQAVRDGLNRMFDDLATEAGIDKATILDSAFVM